MTFNQIRPKKWISLVKKDQGVVKWNIKFNKACNFIRFGKSSTYISCKKVGRKVKYDLNKYIIIILCISY